MLEIYTFTFSTGELGKERFTSEHILKIKEEVGSCWRDLGLTLRIGSAIVCNIGQDIQESRERAHQVLKVWIDQNGREATVGRLACALNGIRRKKIADKLLGM